MQLINPEFLTPPRSPLKFILNESGIALFPVRQEHRDLKLPGRPLMNSLSLTRTGDILVPLIDGRVLCVGGEL